MGLLQGCKIFLAHNKTALSLDFFYTHACPQREVVYLAGQRSSPIDGWVRGKKHVKSITSTARQYRDYIRTSQHLLQFGQSASNRLTDKFKGNLLSVLLKHCEKSNQNSRRPTAKTSREVSEPIPKFSVTCSLIIIFTSDACLYTPRPISNASIASRASRTTHDTERK